MLHSLKDRIVTLVPPQSAVVLTVLTLLLAVLASLIVRALEPNLVLPAFSVLLFLGAALTVLLAVFIKAARNLKELTLWDIAGGFAITGCAASVFSEPDQVTLLFEHLFERHSDVQQD